MMTEDLDLVRVDVAAPIRNSDHYHFSLLAVISMAQAVPNFCVTSVPHSAFLQSALIALHYSSLDEWSAKN